LLGLGRHFCFGPTDISEKSSSFLFFLGARGLGLLLLQFVLSDIPFSDNQKAFVLGLHFGLFLQALFSWQHCVDEMQRVRVLGHVVTHNWLLGPRLWLDLQVVIDSLREEHFFGNLMHLTVRQRFLVQQLDFKALVFLGHLPLGEPIWLAGVQVLHFPILMKEPCVKVTN